MNKLAKCILWNNPELVLDPEIFEIIETYEDESHLICRLMKCRECGHCYFYEFYEEIDWLGGEDAMYRTYVPVDSKETLEELKATSIFSIHHFTPRLTSDLPRGSSTYKIRWIGKGGDEAGN